jgi:hypothetical protein
MRLCEKLHAASVREAQRNPSYRDGYRGGRIARKWRRAHRLSPGLAQSSPKCKECKMTRESILLHPWFKLGSLNEV